jgi:DNA repair protein RecO (recombination protein O)
MEWSDQGIVLAARKHGESSAIVTLLTRAHGRHAGLVRGGAGSRARGTYEPGNEVTARWRARLEEHLGTYTCELTRAHAARLLDEPARLAALSSACAVAEATLPECEPHGAVFESLRAFLHMLHARHWAEAYVRWEIGLLKELGFGLDLSSCAATGVNDRLAYVSPKSGRAVSLGAGEPYRDRLLPLPPFLLNEDEPGARGVVLAGEIADGLRLCGYFLERHVFAPEGRSIPAARIRLVDRLSRITTISRVREGP